MLEPVPLSTTEDHITMEPEQCAPDQVCELAMSSIAEGVLVDFKGLEVSPANVPPLRVSCWLRHC